MIKKISWIPRPEEIDGVVQTIEDKMKKDPSFKARGVWALSPSAIKLYKLNKSKKSGRQN